MSYLNISPKNTGDAVTSTEFNSLVSAIQNMQKATGWAVYFDTQYTLGVPQQITGVDYMPILNNAGGDIKTNLPYGVTKLYDGATNKILPPEINSAFSGYIRFKASINMADGYAKVAVDINASINETFINTIKFPKGANIYHEFTLPINGYMAETFFANGGIPVLLAGDGAIVKVYESVFFINITHRPI